MDLYAENILEHYRNPRSKKRLKKATASREEVNASCGDSIVLDLSLKGKRIEHVGWEGAGCAISQAGMSMLAEEIVGKTMEEALSLPPKFLQNLLGVPISTRRLKCALLPLLALHNALHTQQGRTPETWPELLEEDSA